MPQMRPLQLRSTIPLSCVRTLLTSIPGDPSTRTRTVPIRGQIDPLQQADGGHLLRVRGRCLSRQVFVEAKPPGLNPEDQLSEATEDIVAPQRLLAQELASDGWAPASRVNIAFSYRDSVLTRRRFVSPRII